jgi:regulator of RNase E activity RraB
MRLRSRWLVLPAALLGLLMNIDPLHGDEGMWLFNAPPLKQLKEKYQFEPSKEWLDHLQKSSVRFNSGGSGSFVSPNGLVMTNHHVGADDLQKLSTKEKDYLKDGFHAKTPAEELKCKALELNVLQSIADVTAEVNAAVKAEMAPAEAFKARQQKIGEIEKANADEAKGKRADVVTLFAGGAYHLYTFKKYTDIRLVFAPEKQIAFFGGDPDNFEYPRYDLDMCFFRVYENDKPIQCEHYLKWSDAGAKDGELIFVSGHPGRTSRQNTVAELEYLRDTGYPYLLQRLNRWEVLINSWVQRSEDNRQKGEDELFGIQNSRKARFGGLQGLLDPKLFARKVAEETRLREFAKALVAPAPNGGSPGKAQEGEAALKAFDAIAAAEKKRVQYIKEYTILEGGAGFHSDLFSYARTLLRYADDMKKDPKDRLPEFGAARLASLKFRLQSDEPVYDDFEMLKLADGLTMLANHYGANSEFAQKVLAGKSPKERAFELVSKTTVKDPKVRARHFEAATVPENDPMVELAKLVDEPSRAIRKKVETEIDEPKRQAYAALAKARFALDGTNTYPDATFTLRLAYGTVKGYTEDGKNVPAFTDYAGLYERSKQQGNTGPFELPKRWVEKKDKLDLKTPLNFVSTADIIGGNSGSPVVNAKGEVVGLIFDGNIQSLVLDFIFDQEQARAVSVDSRAMIEALRKVYDAQGLADEIQGKK